MDLIRRNDTLTRKLPLLVGADTTDENDGDDTAADEIPDDRLRLIFTCCHPALAAEARVALTLRLLCGLTTAEVARAFLVSEPTMAARITRAKKKIAAARIPYRVPAASELPDRLAAVLDVVHLVFTTGHTAPAGESLQRRDLAERALDLASMLRHLLPGDPAVAGLLALILLTDARRAHPHHRRRKAAPACRARPHPLGPDRDRRRTRPDPHRPGETTPDPLRADGRHRRRPRRSSPVGIHRLAADHQPLRHAHPDLAIPRRRPQPRHRHRRSPRPARRPAALDQLATEPQLVGYHYLPAARADFLRRLHRADDARLAYHEALLLAGNPIERDFLTRRLGELDT